MNVATGTAAAPPLRIQLLNTDGRSSPISAESLYNAIYDKGLGWTTVRVTDGTFVLIAVDGTPFEIVR